MKNHRLCKLRATAAVLVAALILSGTLSACGSSSGSGNGTPGNDSSTAVAAESQIPTDSTGNSKSNTSEKDSGTETADNSASVSEASSLDSTAVNEDVEETILDGPVGIWDIVGIEQSGESMPEEILESLKSETPTSFYAEIRADGTIFLSVFGGDREGTWDDSNITISGYSSPYTYDEDKGTLSFSDYPDPLEVLFLERTTTEAFQSRRGIQEGALDESVQYSEEEQILLDTEQVSVRITSYKADASGFTVSIHCENKTDDPISVDRSFEYNPCLNRYNIKAYGEGGVYLDAEESTDFDILFKADDIAKCGISVIEEMILPLEISGMQREETMFTVYPTGKKAEEYKVPDRKKVEGEKVLVDNDEITFIVQKVENTSSGSSIDCYYENKTEKPLTFSCESLYINGIGLTRSDDFFFEQTLPESRGCIQIVFEKSQLEKKQIEEVNEITFEMFAYDPEGDGDIFEGVLTYTP